MRSELAYYFEQELRFLRQALLEYAAEHPDAAAKMQINSDGEGYADVERIVHGVAMLNARTACKIDDGHADIIEGFLNVLYPHYLRPLPSMGIVEFAMDSQLAAQSRHTLRKTDDLVLASSSTVTHPCYFRLVNDMDVLPVRIHGIRLSGPKYEISPKRIGEHNQVAALRFSLTRINNEDAIQDTAFPKHLRLFIDEDRDDSFALYEYLLRHASGIAFSLPGQTTPFAELSPESLLPVALNADAERILPYEARSFPGFGLLTELFAYTSRFNFIDLEMPSLEGTELSDAINVHIFFNEQSSRLETVVRDGWLRVNCCPIINLFSPPRGKLIEDYDLASHETPLIVDPDTELYEGEGFSMKDRDEIYSVDSVELFDCEQQTAIPMHPVYSVDGRLGEDLKDLYWTRREYVSSPGGRIIGSDVYLQTEPEIEMTPDMANRLQYRVEVQAMNRRVPLDGAVRYTMQQTIGGLSIHGRRPLTAAIRPSIAKREMWRIINHMALNQGTLLSKESLCEILSLYDMYEVKGRSAATRLIRSVTSLTTDQSVERIRVKDRPVFVRSTEVEIDIDGLNLPEGKAFLFGSLIAAFLAGFISINNCIRVIVFQNGTEIGSWQNFGRKPGV